KSPVLPSVPTFDCSNEQHLAEAKARMDRFYFRTGNSMDPLEPLSGEESTPREQAEYFRRIENSPGRFVTRMTLPAAAGNSTTRAVYGLRTFCVGTTSRFVLRGGIVRECHGDGSPVNAVYNDETASPV
ncbi:MAG: circularly permuted type 2 ATP-grasp protein, partial [Planctomycetaceae bacterium]|nr:circularly permuted type 2 ATP-grasp protein [Planctomycetaceae bacterium]